MGLNKVLKVNNDSELLSFIINTTPELASNIDLPVQGESIAPIGKIIMSNERYKNAFLNTINLIGLTVIDRNYFNATDIDGHLINLTTDFWKHGKAGVIDNQDKLYP